ncbi:MAG: cytochrome b/b6 domain-containing protein [Actinobacteria bacterium]|nr:cytochrome b/b6 domain-containing protein [Actinomycetota bacterium]MBV9663321.1 cytochrome b/b6 domain-containing protein [Actinomycetota bacterium]MBV9934900.1 cytochrome b/b6 domain-containing protein [Actinomycetota bacterium]
MAVATSPSDVLIRFDRVERYVHWINATLFGLCILTGAALYVGPLSAIVGRRELVRTIHVYSGLALPIPILIGLFSSAAFRADVRRFNRFTDIDRKWLRRKGRKNNGAYGLGKFNPGQKLNASFVAGAIIVMAMTGSIMHWFEPFSDSWRTGATFVHDWLAFAIIIVIIGHLRFALGDSDALSAMRQGTISRTWAADKAPLWHEEMTGGE